MCTVNLKSIFGIYQCLQKVATHSSNEENEEYGGRVSNNTDYRRNKEEEEEKYPPIMILQRMFNNIRHPIPCRLDP